MSVKSATLVSPNTIMPAMPVVVRKAIVLPTDLRAAQLAAQIPHPVAPLHQTFTDPEETLREMGHKTFNYHQNALSPVETVNWKEKTDRELDVFVQKASMFAIINLMDETIDGSQALEILNEVSPEKSVLDVYLEKYGKKRSFLQKIQVRWRYSFYFRCNFVPNTLNTFMQAFLGIMRSNLVQKDGGKNLTTLINTALSETSSFLDFYLQGIENYEKGTDLQGARDTHIAKELSKKFGLSEAEVCRKFSFTAVQEFLPRVHFFLGWKNSSWALVRIIGDCLDYTLGIVLNSILKKKLKNTLPSVLQNLVKTSVDATQPQNLPFVIAITQGILEMLRKFKVQVEQTPSSLESSCVIAGTEKLPEVIKKFLDVLSKESKQTRKELQQQSKSGHSSIDFFSQEIDKSIEEGCINGARAFFSYLTKQENSEEIFYLLLNLTNATFESKPQDLQKLQVKYNALKKEMQREAREVFQMVIHRSVNEQIQGPTAAQGEQMAENVEDKLRSRSLEAVRQLLAESHSIQSKLAASTQQLGSDIDIAENLDSMNEAIANYQSLAVLDEFPEALKTGIDRTMLPVFNSMNGMLDQVGHAKKMHQELLQNARFHRELQKLFDMQHNIRSFNILDYKQTLERLHQLCSAMDDSNHAIFDHCLRQFDATYSDVERDCQITLALRTLDQKGGLFPKFYHAMMAQINGLSVQFRWKDLQNIPEISVLPEAEQRELYACIQAVTTCKNLAQMNLKWGELKVTMNRIFGAHHHQLREVFIQNLRWSEQYLKAIEISSESLQKSLVEASKSIATLIQDTERKAQAIHVQKIETIPNRVVNALGGWPATIGATAGATLAAATAFLPGWAAYPVLGIAAAANFWFWGRNKTALINTAAGAALRATAQCIHPAVPILIGAAGGYWEGKKVTTHVCDHMVYPQVRDNFDRLYDFIIKPHVWRWAILDTLKCVHEAYVL